MSNIVLQPNASGTGSITITTPNTNTDRTLNIPDVAGNIVTTGDSGTVTGTMIGSLPAGSIVQVVSTTKTDPFSESVASGSSSSIITGLTASITPRSTNSRILVHFMVDCGQQGTYLTLCENGSAITAATGDAAGSAQRVTATRDFTYSTFYNQSIAGTFVHSPASTSALTYGVKISHSSQSTRTMYVNQTPDGLTDDEHGRAISTLTVMEIQG